MVRYNRINDEAHMRRTLPSARDRAIRRSNEQRRIRLAIETDRATRPEPWTPCQCDPADFAPCTCNPTTRTT